MGQTCKLKRKERGDGKSYYEWSSKGMDDETYVFSDRPYRIAYSMPTEEFFENFDDTFSKESGGKPNGAMIFNLAIANGRIISSSSIETYGEDIGRHPVGTGPFKFQEWIDGQKITVTAFADYWGEPAKVDAIEFRVVPNDATRIALLQSGEAHFIEMVPPALVEALEAAPNVVVEATESVFARIFPLNTQIAPFNDVRVRRALNHAIDREQIVARFLTLYHDLVELPLAYTTREPHDGEAHAAN